MQNTTEITEEKAMGMIGQLAPTRTLKCDQSTHDTYFMLSPCMMVVRFYRWGGVAQYHLVVGVKQVSSTLNRLHRQYAGTMVKHV